MDYLNNAIMMLDDTLTQGDCVQALGYYNQYENIQRHGQTLLVPRADLDPVLSPMVDRIRSRVSMMVPMCLTVYWAHLVCWPQGSSMAAHFDHAHQGTAWTSVTYLNDDYQGGETYVQHDVRFPPKRGRTVTFDGLRYCHGVGEVTQGQRWTIAVWYRLCGQSDQLADNRYI